MIDESVIVQRPSAARTLVLLFHGVGSIASSLEPLAQLIAGHEPEAMVVSVAAARPSSFGVGREWFSVAGVTEENRPARVAQAMPAFEAVVTKWQREAGVDAAHTTLIGFSQGAIMSLEATQVGQIATRVISLSGRFAEAPQGAPAGVVFRFVHGELDPVIDPRFSVEAAERLRALGADATVHLVPGLAHGIDARAANLALEALE